MDLNQYGFNLQSDYNFRILRDDEEDIDIIISLDNKTLNLYFDRMPDYIKDRIQCSMIKNIVIRLSKLKDNSLCTIHLLRNIDLHSSVMNFVFDYINTKFIIEDLEYCVTLKILNNE